MCNTESLKLGSQNTSRIKSKYGTLEECIKKTCTFHDVEKSSGSCDIFWKHASGLIEIAFAQTYFFSF